MREKKKRDGEERNSGWRGKKGREKSEMILLLMLTDYNPLAKD